MEVIVKHFKDLSVYELYQILKMRCDVFVVEQKCIYKDLDDLDQDGYHILIKDEDEYVASARVLDKGVKFEEVSIGRIISTSRKKGYGRLLISEALEAAKKHYNASVITVGAQCQARGFYEKCGFKAFGDIYDEDGIPHIHMNFEVK